MKRRRVFVIASLILVLVLCTGVGTLAYFTDQKQVKNTATFGKLNVETHEKIVEGHKKDVGFTVSSDSVDCWVRVFVGIPKASGDSNGVYECKKHDETNWTNNWKQDGDYYYYLKPVKAGETKILFDSIKRTQKLTDGQQYSNLDIIVYAEAIQYENTTNNPVEAFSLLKK